MNKLAILLIFVVFSAFGQTQNSINDSINDRNNALILKFGINLVDIREKEIHWTSSLPQIKWLFQIIIM